MIDPCWKWSAMGLFEELLSTSEAATSLRGHPCGKTLCGICLEWDNGKKMSYNEVSTTLIGYPSWIVSVKFVLSGINLGINVTCWSWWPMRLIEEILSTNEAHTSLRGHTSWKINMSSLSLSSYGEINVSQWVIYGLHRAYLLNFLWNLSQVSSIYKGMIHIEVGNQWDYLWKYCWPMKQLYTSEDIPLTK